MNRYIPKSDRQEVIERQGHQCANCPGSNSFRLEDVACPLWLNKKKHGLMKDGEYDIDHINELANGGSNDISNLQALCKECHKEKTARFNSERVRKYVIFTPFFTQYNSIFQHYANTKRELMFENAALEEFIEYAKKKNEHQRSYSDEIIKLLYQKICTTYPM